MLNMNSFMIGSSHQKQLAAFYEKMFEKKPDMVEEGWSGWMLGNSFFSVGVHSEIKGATKEPGRLMFNLETTKVKEEFARMVKAGAMPIKEPYEMGGMWIATLADTDGNYFQLMSPWKA
jgi:predicted enzyme related to lactoylglutathione lyase